ncbi:MAG TPA: hypothetical protein DD979_18235 [Gammaproteobacteria bacterium]|nr:hypothetical protein [Gammaproteobacteria bacterium]
MKTLSIRLLRHVTLLLMLTGLSFNAAAQQALLDALREGGNNIYFRHESTDWSQRDILRQQDDWLSCNGEQMRQLTEQGRQRATATGETMRALELHL